MINGRYGALINGVPANVMPKNVYDPDADGKIAIAQLVAAVCSDTEAAALVTFETLYTNEDVGPGAAQVAPGNHTHTLTVTEAFWDGSTKVTGTTSWVQMHSVSIPANAKKVMAWCYGSSDTSLKIGECRLLYNGVQVAYSSGAYYAISPVPWQGDGLGFAANLTVEIKKDVDANKIIYGYGAWYVTI